MYEINSFDDAEEIHSLDLSLKQIPFLSIESKLSVNALYKILLKNPKLINMTDEKKETFLSYAIKRQNDQIIDFIMASPLLDLTYQDKNGNTYLHISVIQQNIKLIQRLIEKKISINIQNKDGNTALHLAYYINNIEIINLLIKNNLDINIKNNQGLIAKEVIPTNDIDKIAGYEVNMNFDVDLDDELKYHNSIKEDKLEKSDIYHNKNENQKNNDNQNKSIDNLSKEYPIKNSKINSKRSSKKSKNNINNNKNINKKVVNNKNNINNENKKKIKNLKIKSLFNNKNNKNINKNDNNDKKIKNKNNNNNKDQNEDLDSNDDYQNLKSFPLKGARKISNIDVIYHENDRFVRRESEFYPFYAELLNVRRVSTISKGERLSNIIENNITSEGNSNNDIGLTNHGIKNNSITSEENSNNEIGKSNDEAKNNNISEGNSNNEIIISNNWIKNNNISLLNNTNKNNNTSLFNNTNNKNNISSIINLKKINSIDSSDNNITMMQNLMNNCTNKCLLDFLLQIKLQKYYNNLNNNGLSDINMIIENAKKGIYLTENDLKKTGITKAGDIAKILIRIQENANIFEFAVPKNVYYIRFNFEKIEDDINILKLYEWLLNIKLEEYLKNFLNNGYFSTDLLFVQLLSNNPLTDEILKNDLGIEKLGYRARILNKLKEECTNYSNKLRESIVTYNSVEINKMCNECKIC